MTHVTDYLAGYLDGQLSDSKRAAVQRHLQGCAVCRAELDAVRGVRQELIDLIPLAMQDVHPPAHNWSRIHGAMGESSPMSGAKRKKKMSRSDGHPSLLMTGFSLAVIALMVLIFAILIWPQGEAGPTVEPTSQPASRVFGLSQDEAFVRLAAILAGESTGDPLTNRQTILAQDGEVAITEEQRFGQRSFFITTERHAADRPLPEGETVTIGGREAVLRTGLSGTVTLTGSALHDGSGEYLGGGGSVALRGQPSEIAYDNGILIAWNEGDGQTSLLTNLTLDDAVAIARTLLSDDDRRAVDGTEPTAGELVALVTEPVGDLSPAWSPDSQLIVFASEQVAGSSRLFTIQIDGEGLTQLTDGAGNDFTPAWSPDGSRIAFGTFRHGQGNGDLYLMDPDGSNLTRLTSNPAYDGEPVWSPDGSRIAFYSDRDGGSDIYVMNADGSNLTRLTDSPASDHSPAWSPDGSHIAFTSDRNGQMDVYVLDVDNPDDVRRVTWHTARDYAPTWSPDGQWIAFSTDRNDTFDIYLAASDGSGVLPFVTTDLDEYFSRWSPDGRWIACAAGRSHVMPSDIYIVPITMP